MKKFIPLILFFLGITTLTLAFFIIKGKNFKKNDEILEKETSSLKLSPNERPFVSLIPASDGHYLKMKVERIKFSAESLDYELLYQVEGGIQQGVPGSVSLEGKDFFEADLLLGSESSGKFRYDEGVETGTLTLRFRDKNGKLLVKFETEFHLQASTKLLTSLDGKFKYELKKKSDGYFVTMNVIGFPSEIQREIVGLKLGPYGIFSSESEALPGRVEFDEYGEYFRIDGQNLVRLEKGESEKLGVFIAVESK